MLVCIAGDTEPHSPSTCPWHSLTAINFSQNFISQQAHACYSSAPLILFPLPAFYVHFPAPSTWPISLFPVTPRLTFPGLHLGLVLAEFTFTLLKLFITHHPGTRSTFQELTYFAVKCLKIKRKDMCRCPSSIRQTHR